MIRGVLVVMLLALAVPAHADDVVAYEAEGDAAAAGADARTTALDDAFAHATASAIADLVSGDARTAHKGELDREIIGHARLWVKSFQVTRDETDDDRRQLAVSVRIDRDKLRARLAELGIPTQDAAAPEPPASSARPVVVLLRIASPHGVRADFGDAADAKLPGVTAATGAMRAAGYAVRKPASGGPAPHDGDLPLADDEAISAASAAGAELALVAGVTIGAPSPAHGVAGDVALVTAHVRLLDRDKPVGQGVATAAAISRGDDDGTGYAVERAVADALADVLPPAPRKLVQAGSYQGDDQPIAGDGVVLVRLPAKTPWPLVQAEQKYLAGARGVRAATLRRLSPHGWVIGVATSESIDRVASIARRAPAASTNASSKIVGSVVEVTLEAAP